jgi:hypothetical protein
MPLVSALLRNTTDRTLPSRKTIGVDLGELFATGLDAGTDPGSPEFWGQIADRDPSIVEAADVALALWVSRDGVWSELPQRTQRQIADWLGSVNGKKTVDNNWHLFIVLINAVLSDLDQAHDEKEMHARYSRFKQFYRSDGWYSDGPDDKFDYYNAWGIHYALNWVRQIRPGFDADFLAESSAQFNSSFKYFFGPHGFPIMGRSVCYRMAAPVPLIQSVALADGSVPPAQARRALDLIWRFFIAKGAVSDGTCTQGYGRPDPRILDGYSGPASPLWSLRSLVAAVAIPESDAFWQLPAEPLPVEVGDFEFEIKAIGWRVRGERATGDVCVYPASSRPDSETRMQPYPWGRRLLDRVRNQVMRPDNISAKYHRRVYCSREPFCGFG